MEGSKKLLKRSEIPDTAKWDVNKIFASDDKWEEAFKVAKEEAKKLSEYQGKLKEANMLLEFLKLDEKISRDVEKIMMYAFLKSDEDTKNTTYQGIKGRVNSYVAELQGSTAFFVPEILSFEDDFVEKVIKENKELELYRFYLERIMSKKPHILTKEKEELLASASELFDAPHSIYSIFANADLKFPKIKNEENEEMQLTEAMYSQFIKSKDRNVRENAFRSLFKTYGEFRNTIATSLVSSIKTWNFNAKIRSYSNAIESALAPNNIPVSVYDNTIEAINKNLPLLHRYVKLKKKMLKLDEIHMYDLYVPVIDTPKEHIEFKEAVTIANEALKPLGDEYLSIFNSGIENSWIDIYPNEGKRSGAYSWGCYDTMPYVLLNYTYELNDVSTFVHEMGHSIHSYYSRKSQPYIYSDYVIFCAEVASTTNEILLINHLIHKEKDKTKKLYLINSQLEQIRATVFRQVMFAEFEKITHETLEKGDSLTADDLCSIWHNLNVKYFGPDMVVDEEIDMEWARIPHFYSDFYVYQYATGYAAASSFAKMILEEKEGALEKYKGFLKSGGSNYPIEILKEAGVDMTTAKPIEDQRCLKK